MGVRNFRELDAWRVAIDLAIHLYTVINKLPPNERFEMASQMRRAALSVPSNIAEGHASRMRGRYRHHVRIALGSVAELATCIELAGRVGYLHPAIVSKTDAVLVKMTQLLHGVLRGIRKKMALEGTAALTMLVVWFLIS
jgi:four helix bundle protein